MPRWRRPSRSARSCWRAKTSPRWPSRCPTILQWRATRAASAPSPRGRYDPAFEAAAFALKNPGDISEPVLSRFGYHVIRLEGRTPERQQTFDEVRGQILADMRQKSVNDARESAIAAIRGDSRLQVNREAVDALVLKVDIPPLPPSGARAAHQVERRSAAAAGHRACAEPRRSVAAGGSCYPAGMTESSHRIAAGNAPIAVPRFAAESRRNRALFANFFMRELTTRYLGSATGLAWALLHPLALLAVYHFVFTTVFRAGSFDGRSFLLFVAVALWPWLAAQEGLQRATVSLAELRRADPQGRVPARARRLRVGRGDARAAVRGLPRGARRAGRVRGAGSLRGAARSPCRCG